jgi:hypothetical protein
MRQVLLARPRQLHRPPTGLERDAHGLRDEIDLESAPEAAAEVGDAQIHRVARHARHLRGDVACQARHLRRCPHVDRAVGHASGAVHRLHRHVGQIGRAVERLDASRGRP